MSIGRRTVRGTAAVGVALAWTTDALAHEGHVIGTGLAASMLHALEHGLGVLAVAAAGVALAWGILREPRATARTLVRRRDFS